MGQNELNFNEWSIAGIWNESLEQKQKPIKQRNYIYAGDIGKNFYERYLKMQGVVPTNPYNERTLRKFAAGNFFEDLIGNVLQQIGILKSSQEWVQIPADKRHLRITGRLDYIAGGLADWQKARQKVKETHYPEAIENISLKLIDYFQVKHPQGLEEIVYEIKSINSLVFWQKQEYLSEAYPHHIMQLYTYLKALNKPKGRILYISKDDLTIKEIGVLYPTERLEKQWNEDVEQMTNYYRERKEPPKPDSIVFDKRKSVKFQKDKIKYKTEGAWVSNWEVEWSSYFKLITGYDEVDEWKDSLKSELKEKNDLLKTEKLNGGE